jgi:hypothetical protein
MASSGQGTPDIKDICSKGQKVVLTEPEKAGNAPILNINYYGFPGAVPARRLIARTRSAASMT